MGGSTLASSFDFYFFKLHLYLHTLPPLIKQRNKCLIFFSHSLHSFPVFWGGGILGPGFNCRTTATAQLGTVSFIKTNILLKVYKHYEIEYVSLFKFPLPANKCVNQKMITVYIDQFLRAIIYVYVSSQTGEHKLLVKCHCGFQIKRKGVQFPLIMPSKTTY